MKVVQSDARKLIARYRMHRPRLPASQHVVTPEANLTEGAKLDTGLDGSTRDRGRMSGGGAGVSRNPLPSVAPFSRPPRTSGSASSLGPRFLEVQHKSVGPWTQLSHVHVIDSPFSLLRIIPSFLFSGAFNTVVCPYTTP
jgi:hypothetical protein